MKRMIESIFKTTALVLLTTLFVTAQKIDEERMKRDIKVAENVLETLIKQKFEGKRIFFSLDVNGSYREGYGVTFSLPSDYKMPFSVTIADYGDGSKMGRYKGMYGMGERGWRPEEESWDADHNESHATDHVKTKDGKESREVKEVRKEVKVSKVNSGEADSLRNSYNHRLIEAATEFIADYGDIISQLSDTDRIVITNRSEQPRMWMGRTPSRTHLSLEVSRAPVMQFRQGKINRNQLIEKIKVVNTQSTDEVDPDLELLSSIFNRLYRSDLSKTFFSDGDLYYERLKDYGVIFYMKVFSSNRTFNDLYDMPTVDMRGVTQADRDKKVKELYPVFEKDIKESIIEYGRTVKSLGNDESLIFDISLTRCNECGIPSSLEISVKASVLKDYNAGKINMASALSKVNVKKEGQQ